MKKVRTVDLVTALDERGILSAAQYPDQLPFEPVRVFIVTKSPSGTTRGGHAHRRCHQILVATAGLVRVEYDDSDGSGSITLDSATSGLYVPPLAWAKQTYLTEGASIVVLASHLYDPDDYIDSRDEAYRLRQLRT